MEPLTPTVTGTFDLWLSVSKFRVVELWRGLPRVVFEPGFGPSPRRLSDGDHEYELLASGEPSLERMSEWITRASRDPEAVRGHARYAAVGLESDGRRGSAFTIAPPPAPPELPSVATALTALVELTVGGVFFLLEEQREKAREKERIEARALAREEALKVCREFDRVRAQMRSSQKA